MLVEFALAWMGSTRAIERVPVSFEGLEHLEAARAAGHGVLLVGAHFSHLELCARLVSQRIRIAGMYREHDDAAFEWAIKRARLRYADAMFTKDELRQSVRYLKAGGTLWYAPDQDMRGKDVVFAPFFGVPAATITATHHLARLSGARVIAFFHRRRDDGGYAIRLEAPLADFPERRRRRRHRARERLHRTHGARGAEPVPLDAQTLQDAAARGSTDLLSGSPDHFAIGGNAWGF